MRRGAALPAAGVYWWTEWQENVRVTLSPSGKVAHIEATERRPERIKITSQLAGRLESPRANAPYPQGTK